MKRLNSISEKQIKQILEVYLISQGWQPEIRWGSNHGLDIEARRDSLRWIIEVKASHSSSRDIVNPFVSVLGEILQRMDDPRCKYSIALPDTDPFRRLWARLPAVARNRTMVTALFVSLSGEVEERLS